MINKEWEDFFGIEEASDTSYIETDFNIKQKMPLPSLHPASMQMDMSI